MQQNLNPMRHEARLFRRSDTSSHTITLRTSLAKCKILDLRNRSSMEKGLEARVGIEPTHKGFADLSLTTWVPRLGEP